MNDGKMNRREFVVGTGVGVAVLGVGGCGGGAMTGTDGAASADMATAPAQDMAMAPGQDMANAPAQDMAMAPRQDMANPCPGVKVVNISAIGMNGAEFDMTNRLYVCSDGGGIYALTSVCTHSGCDVSFVNKPGFSCGCHGSQFNFNGAVTQGPAGAPLRHFAVCIDKSGNAWVDPATVVPATTRTR